MLSRALVPDGDCSLGPSESALDADVVRTAGQKIEHEAALILAESRIGPDPLPGPDSTECLLIGPCGNAA